MQRSLSKRVLQSTLPIALVMAAAQGIVAGLVSENIGTGILVGLLNILFVVPISFVLFWCTAGWGWRVLENRNIYNVRNVLMLGFVLGLLISILGATAMLASDLVNKGSMSRVWFLSWFFLIFGGSVVNVLLEIRGAKPDNSTHA